MVENRSFGYAEISVLLLVMVLMCSDSKKGCQADEKSKTRTFEDEHGKS